MHTDYPGEITMREARQRYFDVNGFGDDGGYDEPWVDFKLGPVPLPFPNSPARRRAVGYHDLHHVLTGYDTDFLGELEISAWEIGAGCKDFAAAWILNLAGLAGGGVLAPKRTYRAFVRGRRQNTLYGESLDGLLDSSVDDVRMRFGDPSKRETATVADGVAFAAAFATGWMVGTLLLAFMLPMVPIGIVTGLLRKKSA